GRPERPYAMTFNPDGKRFYVFASEPDVCYVFETATATQVDKFKANSGGYGAGRAFNPDGTKLCTLHHPLKSIAIIDVSTKQSEIIVITNSTIIRQVMWSRDGSKIYVNENISVEGRLGSCLVIVDPTKKQPHKRLSLKPGYLIESMIPAPLMPD